MGKSGNIQRPRRRASNSHFFRYLQHSNPTRLEEIDLKRALEATRPTNQPENNRASLEDQPWSDDAASSSSSDQTSSSSSSNGSMQKSHLSHRLNHFHHTHSSTANSSVHKRFKPIAKRSDDFWHDGVLDYVTWKNYNNFLAKHPSTSQEMAKNNQTNSNNQRFG